MTNNEMAVLSMVALRILRLDQKGRIWRTMEVSRGSKRQGRLVPCRPRRADGGRSSKKGYRRVQVTIGRDRHTAPAHRIVWMITNGRPVPDGLEINHKDGNKENNAPENLEVVVRSENAKHALRELGAYRLTAKGEKLTAKEALEIRHLCDANRLSRPEIAEMYRVSVVTVRKIANRQSWKSLPT